MTRQNPIKARVVQIFAKIKIESLNFENTQMKINTKSEESKEL